MKRSLVTLCSLTLFACALQNFVFSEGFFREQLTRPTAVTDLKKQQSEESPEEFPNESEEGEWSKQRILRRIETVLALMDGLFTIQEAIEEYVLPQSKTEENILDIVNRLEDLIRPNDESQYKKAEDAILRALFDMGTSLDGRKSSIAASEFQKLLWLERARRLDGDVILVMEGLLGQPVAGADLMKNIKVNSKCNATKIFEKVNRFNDLIENGLIAFNHFAAIGQMSAVELSRRKIAVEQRNVRVMARNVELIKECFQFQLSEIQNETTTDRVAERVANVLSTLYPLPMRWIVAVYCTVEQRMSSFSPFAALKPIKPKVSADYIFHTTNGFHAALFPFMEGMAPNKIEGQRIDEFCEQPIREAGGMSTCDVGSSDGEYVFNELRRLGIISNSTQLIVIPSEGQLSIRTIPLESFPPFFFKKYPDFDIVAF